MGILILLVPVTLGLGLIGLLAYYWAVGKRQFDDLETPAYRILFDEDQQNEKEKSNGNI